MSLELSRPAEEDRLVAIAEHARAEGLSAAVKVRLTHVALEIFERFTERGRSETVVFVLSGACTIVREGGPAFNPLDSPQDVITPLLMERSVYHRPWNWKRLWIRTELENEAR